MWKQVGLFEKKWFLIRCNQIKSWKSFFNVYFIDIPMREYFFYWHIGYGRMAAAMSYNYANVCLESRLIVTGKD